MQRKKRPHYATRAEYEADTTFYWDLGQVLTFLGTVIVALGIVAAAYMLS